MSEVTVLVRRLAADLPLPRYESADAAGMDLLAAVEADLTLAPGAFALVPTGLAIALPPGHEAQVRPRSGLAAKHGVTVLNSPGTVDADPVSPLGPAGPCGPVAPPAPVAPAGPVAPVAPISAPTDNHDVI